MRFVPGWIPATLLLLCFLLFGLGLGGPMFFDSEEVLSNNSELHLDPGEFIQWRNAVFSSRSGPSGRPVSMLTFALNYSLPAAASAFAFKLVNLFIHGLTGALIFLFLRRLLNTAVSVSLSPRRAEWVALTAAGLWLFHPLQVSTVLYVVQRMEQLSALFSLLGLIVYLHYRPRWLQREATAAELSHCCLLLLICLLLAALAKEDGVLMLPLLLLVEMMAFRCRYNGRESRLLVVAGGVGLYLPLLLVIGLWLLQPQWLTAGYAGRSFTLEERLLTQARVLWQYLGWILVPDIRQLALHHDNILVSSSLMRPLTTLLAMLSWALLLLAAVFYWRRWPIFFFALGWFLILHMLEATVLPLELAYEHRNYLAVMGPCLLLSWGIWCALPSLKTRHRVSLASLVLLILALQLASRASLWADEEQMAAYHLYHHPDSLRSVYHYANTELELGEAATDPELAARYLERSRQYYEEMLRLDPRDMTALVTLLYLDSRYFSSLASERWVGELRSLASYSPIRRNDKAALNLLLDCISRQLCDMSGETYTQILQSLVLRYPRSPIYLDLLARYYGQVEKDYPQALHYAQQLIEAHPKYLAAYLGSAAWHSRNGERGQMLENLETLLRLDSGPSQVQRIKALFAPDPG